MMADHKIKRGVSLYSFQEEYFLRKMSLEDIIADERRSSTSRASRSSPTR